MNLAKKAVQFAESYTENSVYGMIHPLSDVKLEAPIQVVEKVEEEDDKVHVILEDGQVYLSKFVIGADGLWSKTRKMLSDDEPVCSKYVAYRGTIPVSEMVEEAGTNMDDVIMWIGPHLHLVQYPVRSGKLYNQVIVFKSFRYKEGSNDWGTPDEINEHFGKCCETVQHAVSYISRQRRWPV